MDDSKGSAAFSCWAAVVGSTPNGEAALFNRIAARLAEGAAPDMMGDDEAALEALSANRGFEVMTASLRRGDTSPPTIDPVYFECLRASEEALLRGAKDAAARDAIGFLMTCLRDAFDLGRGRGMAGGEQAMMPPSSSEVH